MTGILITGAAAAVISAAAFMKFRDISEKDRKQGRALHWLAAALTVFLITDTAAAYITARAGMNMFSTVNLIFIVNFLFLLGVIDIRNRKIPNLYAAAALVIRTVLVLIQGIAEGRTAELFLRSAAGFAAGAVITGIAYAVSRKGMGSGDVKMYAVLGYFTGAAAVIDILVYSTVFCCLCGILLLIFRKCTLRDCIPMAPFAYAGTLLYLAAGM